MTSQLPWHHAVTALMFAFYCDSQLFLESRFNLFKQSKKELDWCKYAHVDLKLGQRLYV